MKYYIIAGEASGDLHASNLMKALRDLDKDPVFRFWGGDKMEAAGGTLVKHYRETAYMGFLEGIKHLRPILKNLAFCKKDIEQFQPDALILIDYPGFNFRIGSWAQKKNYKIFYYIAPQVWAWKARRALTLKEMVEQLYVILPFEADFFLQYDFEVNYVGHPLLDAIRRRSGSKNFRTENHLNDKPIIALLPGSRNQEIKRLLPTMSAMANSFPAYQFVVAAVETIPMDFYISLVDNTTSSIKFVTGKTYDLLENAHAALVTSGTATLETALFAVPQIVCYASNPLSFQIAKRLVRVKYISLVNLILDQALVCELIQRDFNFLRLKAELIHLLTATEQERIRVGYTQIEKKLEGEGASMRTAHDIYLRLTAS